MPETSNVKTYWVDLYKHDGNLKHKNILESDSIL